MKQLDARIAQRRSEMKLRRYRPVSVVLLVLHIGACTTWQPVRVNPRQFIEEKQPSEVRVTSPYWRSIVVSSPAIVNDSIAGVPDSCESPVFDEEGRRVCVTPTTLFAVSDVGRVETQRVSAPRTALAILAGGLVIKTLYDALKPTNGWRGDLVSRLCISC